MFWSLVLILVPIVMIGAGVCFFIKTDMTYPTISGVISIISLALGGLWLVIICLSLPLERMDNYADIKEFKALEQTINRQRSLNIQLENAALTIKIAEMNQWLAKVKYYGNIFSFWYPNEIRNLKPIE